MTLARATRILLALAAAYIVAWSFYDVGHRAVARWRGEHAAPVTITMMHWGEQAEDAVVEKLVQRYQRENPRVKIERINAGATDFRAKLKTMMAAGTPPDLFYLPPDALPELATQKLIRPIDDYIAKERATGQGAYLDDFWPILMEAWHYDPASGQIGKGKLFEIGRASC